MYKIKFLVIIYNSLIYESSTINSLSKQIEKENFVIFDNSIDFDILKNNKNLCAERGFAYLSFNENKGLSKAYNYVISNFEFNYLVLCDQDTIFDQDFYLVVKENIIKNTKTYVFVPYVYSNKSLLSPCAIKGHRIKLIDVKKIKDGNLTAINSGMVIKREVFNIIGLYDENLFLDCVDHNFMRKINKVNLKIQILNTNIIQSFSGNSKQSQAGAEQRFKIFVNDYKKFCCDTFIGRIYYIFKIKYRALKLNKIYNTKNFTKILKEKKLGIS